MDNSYLYGQPQMAQPMMVPQASVDQNFSIPGMGGMQPQQQQMPQQPPPELQHVTDVLQQYIQSKQGQQGNNGGMLQQIFANRLQPEMQDIQRSVNDTNAAYGAPNLVKALSPQEEMATRYANELSPYTSMLEAQGKMGTNMMNMSGGGTGVLANRLMQESAAQGKPMTFADALYAVQGGNNKGLMMMPDGSVQTIMGAPTALGQLGFGTKYGETMGTKQVEQQYNPVIAGATEAAQQAQKQNFAGGISQQTEMGKNRAENLQQGIATNDIVGLYSKLQTDAKTAPSGYLQSQAARAANAMNMPTKGSVAQATFDADLNNLYLATIRSLKGTGRVMEQELNKISEAAPKSTDSMPVKIAKAQAHMAYYQQRMQSLGFDPSTGQPQGAAPGGIAPPPTPDQINQQMPGAGGAGGATHSYNPATGQLEPLQ